MGLQRIIPPMSRMLYLIDGHAQIFRAYYAIRGGMTSPVTGEPTHAVFAFAGMLFKLFEQYKPEHVVMVVDTPGKTFRDEIYSEYKANRDSPPDDFAPQVQRIFEMTRMFGIPILGQTGAEADDVIATCVRHVEQDDSLSDVNIRMVTKDKDLEQLLSDRTVMFDIHTDMTIDVERLKEDKGITPHQVVDLLALTGDKVDNIPGVDGVGNKTAAKLLQEYGNIDGIYANIDKIKGKRKEKLEAAKDRMPLNLQLVKLKDDLDLPFDMETARARPIEGERLKRFFTEMGFRRHSSDLDKLLEKRAASPPAAPTSNDDGGFGDTLFDMTPMSVGGPDEDATPLHTADEYNYRAITTEADLKELVETISQQSMLAVDTETVGLGHRAKLCGICIAWKTEEAVYIPTLAPQGEKYLDEETVLEALRPVLESINIKKCGHNIKYDLLVLRHAGINMRGTAFDSMIAANLLNLPGRGMDDLAVALLQHHTIPITKLIGERGRGLKQKTMDQVPLDQITPYAAEDADITLRFYEKLQPQLAEQDVQSLADEVEMPLVEVLAEMEFNGIRIDPTVLEEQQTELSKRIDVIRDEIFGMAGAPFNLDSPKQLAEVLFTQLKLPVIKKTKTGPSTDIEVLEKLADHEDLAPEQAALPRMIVEYRQMTKLVSTYLGALRDSIYEKTGRVHASFHQTGAATGRLSSSGPNLQNIPIRTEMGRQIRKAFVAEPAHVLISADYSQIELRFLAHFSEDPALTAAFEDEQDIHTAVAAQVFGVDAKEVSSEQRAQAKVVNFGIIYGITAFGLARRIEGLDRTAAKALIENYRDRFKGIDTFLGECVVHAEQHGYVSTILGRRREVKQLTSRNPQTRALGERLAINTVIQGSAADLIKLAMVKLHHRIHTEQLPMKILLQIHDELVVESPAGEAERCAAILTEEMENAMSLRVPLKVDAGYGTDWLAAK